MDDQVILRWFPNLMINLPKVKYLHYKRHLSSTPFLSLKFKVTS